MLLLVLGSTSVVRASHLLGGDLTYQYIGPGNPYTGPGYVNSPTQRYKVTLTSYRDCGGIGLETSYTLNANNFACGGSGATIMTTLARVGNTTYGNAYCAAVGNATTCQSSSSIYSNYELGKFEATIDLPAAPLWRLNVTYSARPSLANSTGQPNMYWEATLNNSISGGGAVQTVANNSPQFSAAPVTFVTWKQAMFVNLGAFDVDGDSLSFSLVNSLTSCNTPVAYSSFPVISGSTAGDTIINGQPVPCLVQVSNMPITYSPTMPLPSFTVGGACPLKTLTPYFAFDASSGNLAFTPYLYDGTSPESLGKNKYAVTVQVKEWRRINGSYQQVGSARRDMLFFVYDCGTNLNPKFDPNVLIGTQFQPLSQAVTAPRGRTTSVLVQAFDANPGQVLTISGNATGVAGATVSTASPNVAQVDFTPPASLPDGMYYVTVTATDNACPVKGYTTQTVAFRVTSTTLAARSAAKLVVSASPNPFTDQVKFTLARPGAGAESVLIIDQLGRVVERLSVPAGAAGAEASVIWRPTAHVPAGVYLARFENGQQTVRLLRTQQ